MASRKPRRLHGGADAWPRTHRKRIGGGGRTRTYEGYASGFTVRPLCRSGHSPALAGGREARPQRAAGGSYDEPRRWCQRASRRPGHDRRARTCRRPPIVAGPRPAYKPGMSHRPTAPPRPQRRCPPPAATAGGAPRRLRISSTASIRCMAALANPRRVVLRVIATPNALARLAEAGAPLPGGARGGRAARPRPPARQRGGAPGDRPRGRAARAAAARIRSTGRGSSSSSTRSPTPTMSGPSSARRWPSAPTRC